MALGGGLSGITVDGACYGGSRRLAPISPRLPVTDMEPLSGIPGSVGGASSLERRCLPKHHGRCLESVRVYSAARARDGTRGSSSMSLRFDVDELNLGYRKEPHTPTTALSVLSATFNLAPGNTAMIKADMDDLRQRREDGSRSTCPTPVTQREGRQAHHGRRPARPRRRQRPGGESTAAIVNADHATAADVDKLIRHIQAAVKDQFGVDLQPRSLVGEFLNKEGPEGAFRHIYSDKPVRCAAPQTRGPRARP